MSLLFKQPTKAAYLAPVLGVLLGLASPAHAMDSDGNLTAAGIVSEPVAISSTLITAGTAVDVFDFELTDGGSGDGFALDISEITLNVSGTATTVQWSKVTWRINGAGASNVVGTYSADTNKLTFSGLSISVADGGNEAYTLSAFYNDNAGLMDGATFVISVDGDSDVVASAAGTQMGATTAVNNGAGSEIDVTATQLVYATDPAGSDSGLPLSTQPVVAAQDAAGNTDKDFVGTVTILEDEDSNGGVINNTVAAVAGVAAFTNLTYTATADNETFKLVADDAGALAPIISASLQSDVKATKLAFIAQPAPQQFADGVAVSLTADPVVHALNAQDLLDTDFTAAVELSEINGAGSVAMTGAGDTDANADTVTLDAVAGVVTFDGVEVTYTAAGASSESFKLQASTAGLALK